MESTIFFVYWPLFLWYFTGHYFFAF